MNQQILYGGICKMFKVVAIPTNEILYQSSWYQDCRKYLQTQNYYFKLNSVWEQYQTHLLAEITSNGGINQ
jgi:hypothetical protein